MDAKNGDRRPQMTARALVGGMVTAVMGTVLMMACMTAALVVLVMLPGSGV